MSKSMGIDPAYAVKLEALIELAHILKHEGDFKQILRITTEKAKQLFAADSAMLMMINPQTHKTLRTVFSGEEAAADPVLHAINSSISGWVIKYNSILLSQNFKKDTRFRQGMVKKASYASVMCSPLYSEGVIIGTLLTGRENETPFSEEDPEYLQQFSSIVSPFLRNVQKVQQYFHHQVSDQTLIDKYQSSGLIGKSRKFNELLTTIETATQSDIRVLIEGESGTGKELVARAIHQYSSRAKKKFIALDCGTIPENLMESVLFGHVKGAFSGAVENQKGLIQEADGGTLFLDEIANIPLALQVKLLRFLQEGEIRPTGSNKITNVDVRIISASGQSLYQLAKEQKFREDLFYRLYVYPIKVPSLQERRDDIPLLANHFLNIFSNQQNKKINSFHEEVIDFLAIHPWPGNIRELENFIERIVVMAPVEADILDHSILPQEFRKKWSTRKSQAESVNISLFKRVQAFETELIKKILQDHNWNQAGAARALNISEPTIRYKMKKFAIIKPKK